MTGLNTPTITSTPIPTELPPDPVGRLTSYPLGVRVVVRYRIPGGFTDALGDLHALDGVTCTVLTRRGPVEIALAGVVAAKRVPPPPMPRARR